MKRIVHPGPSRAQRLSLCKTHGRRVEVTLKAGVPLMRAVADEMERLGTAGAWFEIKDAPCSEIAFVIPADAPDDAHVAWYSETFRLREDARITHLGMTVGRSGDEWFLHGHGLWREASGPELGGHILPDETYLSRDVVAQGITYEHARFERRPDAETNFHLFQPVALKDVDGDFALLWLAPHEDFSTSLDRACAALGWGRSRAYGLGSIIGARFTDGRVMESYATELLVRDAFASADGSSSKEPDIAIVGKDGVPMTGNIKRGANPVLITAEIVLERI